MKARLIIIASALVVAGSVQPRSVESARVADDGRWTLAELPTAWVGHWLADIDMLSSTDGWAVGHGGVLRYANGTWSRVIVPHPASSLRAVDMVSSSDGWAVGSDGVVLRFDGTEWLSVRNPFSGTRRTLFAIDMVSATDGWIVGSSGAMMRFDGAAWRAMPGPAEGMLIGVDMVTASDGWAVGQEGDILHFDGTSWSAVATRAGEGTESKVLTAVSMASATDGWIASGRSLLRYDGTEWRVVPGPAHGLVADVRMVSSTDGWAVGAGILRFRNGVWVPSAAPATRCSDDEVSFTGVSLVASEDVWVSGACGSLIGHYVAGGGDGGGGLGAPRERLAWDVWMPVGLR
ncbi:MAG: hypothetical protein IT332_02185 [Ardenticatenales bacterium]|nr:hypothetical protein [Ardenticatenales bacterium]